MTVPQRLDAAFDRIARLGATAKRIVLTEADRQELALQEGRYRDVPVVTGQIGGHSYVETEGAPSGDTNFAI